MSWEVAADIQTIFIVTERAQDESKLRRSVEIYAQSAPKLANWLEDNISESLTMSSSLMENLYMVCSINSLLWVCLENQQHIYNSDMLLVLFVI